MNYPFTYYVDEIDHGANWHTIGRAKWFLVYILKAYRDDVGLHQHEFTHVRQWLEMTLLSGLLLAALGVITLNAWWAFLPLAPILHGLLYSNVDRYRLWAEVQAFKKQATYYPDDRKPQLAYFIAVNYGLSVTQEDALHRLRQ